MVRYILSKETKQRAKPAKEYKQARPTIGGQDRRYIADPGFNLLGAEYKNLGVISLGNGGYKHIKI